MRVTLVLPNYNHSRYLPELLGAIFAQTRPADEIIVIDDGSDDDSLQVIDALVAGHPGVKVVRRPARGGVVNALNQGLEMATGEAIGFLAADDRVHPDFVERLVAGLDQNPDAGFACGRAELCDLDGARIGERPVIRPTNRVRYVPPAEAARQLKHADNFFLSQVTLYRTRALRDAGGFDPSLGSFTDGLVLRRLAVSTGYVFVPKLLGIWRIHGHNYSMSALDEPQILADMIENARSALSGTGVSDGFPADYPNWMERRMRFNYARQYARRLALRDRPIEPFLEIMGGTRFDRMVVSGLIARVRPLAPILAKAWLTLRLRPFSVTWMVWEVMCRALDRTGATRVRADT